MIITIDGPTASGKSTIARALAEKLHFYYLSSGILFRAVAYALLQNGYTYDQFKSLTSKDIASYLHQLAYHYSAVQKEYILFDGNNITPFLKTSDIDRGASIIALNKHVRTLLVKLQRKIAQEHDIVIEGRDSGSVVFPRADIKFYVTASSAVRSRRWQHDQKNKGKKFTLKESASAIKERDMRDSSRKIAPLIIPKEAVRVNTTSRTLQEVVALMLNEIYKNNNKS